jgi:hypothetical protein
VSTPGSWVLTIRRRPHPNGPTGGSALRDRDADVAIRG